MPVWFIFSYFSIYFVLKFALISYSSTNSTSWSHPQQPPCPRRTGLSWEQGSPLLLWHLSSILDSTSFLTQTLHLFTKVPSFLINWNVSWLTLESLDYQHHLPPHQLLSSHLLDLFSFPRHTHVHRFLFPLKWLWGCCCLFWCLTSNTWIWRGKNNSIVLYWVNCPPYIFTRQKRGIEFLKPHWWTHSSVYQQMMVQLLRFNMITERICLSHVRYSWFVPQRYILYVFFSILVCNIC